MVKMCTPVSPMPDGIRNVELLEEHAALPLPACPEEGAALSRESAEVKCLVRLRLSAAKKENKYYSYERKESHF